MRHGLKIIFGLILLALLVLAAWLALSYLIPYVTGLDKTILAAVIAGSVAIFSVVFTYWKERSKARKEAHRQKKIDVYSIFFDIVFDVLKNSKTDDGVDKFINSTHFKNTYMDLMKGVTFYGSPDVIRALGEWKKNPNSASDPLHAIRQVGTVLLEMRKDIGLSNFGIDNLSIHQIYVIDDLSKLGQE